MHLDEIAVYPKDEKINLDNITKNSVEYFTARLHNKNVDRRLKNAAKMIELYDKKNTLNKKIDEAKKNKDFYNNPTKYISQAELNKVTRSNKNITNHTIFDRKQDKLYNFNDFPINDNKKIVDLKDFIINFIATSGLYSSLITLKVTRDDIDKNNFDDKVTDIINYYLSHHSPGIDSNASWDSIEDVQINSFKVDKNIKINNFEYDYQKGELVKVEENCIKEALKMAGISDNKINKIPDGGVSSDEFEVICDNLNIPVEFNDIKGSNIFKSKSTEKKKKVKLTLVGANHVELSSENQNLNSISQTLWLSKQQIKDKLFDVVFNDKIVPIDCKFRSSSTISSFTVKGITYINDPIDRFETCPNDKTMLEFALDTIGDGISRFKSEYNEKSLKLVSEWAASPTVEKFIHTDELCDSFDINRCYATLLEKCDIDFPVFSIYDQLGSVTSSRLNKEHQFVSTKGSSKFCEYFNIDVDDEKKLGYSYTFKARELWKEISLVSEVCYPKEEYLTIATDKYVGEGSYYYTERNLWVSHRYYLQYPEIKVSKFSKHIANIQTSKLLINSIIGCFAKTNKIVNNYTLSVNYNEANLLSDKYGGGVDIIADFDMHQYLFITNDVKVSVKLSNFRPIYNMIVEYGNIMIDKLMKSVFDYKNTVYEIKTDSITVKKGSVPTVESILPLTFKQEKSKFMNKVRIVNGKNHDNYKNISFNTRSNDKKYKDVLIIDEEDENLTRFIGTCDIKIESMILNYDKEENKAEIIKKYIEIVDNAINARDLDLGSFQPEERVNIIDRLITDKKSFIIDGDGGCGKSHLIKSIQEKLTKENIKFKTITTKRCNAQTIDGITIHKFLGFNDSNIINKFVNIDYDYVIIDEYTQCSFFKNLLEYKLNGKIRNFILLGNYRQLPGFMDSKYNDLKNAMDKTNKKQHLYDPPEYYNIDIIKDLCEVQIFLKKNYRTQHAMNIIKVDKINFSENYDTILAYSNAECDEINAKALEYFNKVNKGKEVRIKGQVVLYKDTRYKVINAITKSSKYVLSTLGLNKKTIEITKDEFEKCVFNLCITIYKSQGYEYDKYLVVGYDMLVDKNKYVAESRRTGANVYVLNLKKENSENTIDHLEEYLNLA